MLEPVCVSNVVGAIFIAMLTVFFNQSAEYLETLIWSEDWDFSRKALFTVFLDFAFLLFSIQFLRVFHIVYYEVVYYDSLVFSITLNAALWLSCLLINDASITFIKNNFSPILAGKIF